MLDGTLIAESCKARLVLDDDEKPIQMTLSSQQAADLAFIASDFAKQVTPTDDEVSRLIRVAEMVGIKLDDLVAARKMLVE